MKKVFYFLLLMAFIACKNNETIDSQTLTYTPSNSVFFKAKMNDVLWEAPRPLVYINSRNPLMLDIYGRQSEVSNSARNISFRVPLSAKANDKIEIVKGVDCKSNQSFASVIEDRSDNTFTNFESELGEIIIKYHNIDTKQIDGVFQFTAKGSDGNMTISEGAFSLKY
jgi:Family of unknown function (DUF6252)